MNGLEYLHSNRIAHLDLTLENWLLSKNYKLKITESGSSKSHQVFPYYEDTTISRVNFHQIRKSNPSSFWIKVSEIFPDSCRCENEFESYF